VASLTHLNDFGDSLRARLGSPVFLGRPDKAVGLYIWPWRAVTNPSRRNLPLPKPGSGGVAGPRAPDLDVHFLLLPSPANNHDGLARLEAARKAIDDNPILNLEATGVRLQVIEESIPPADLASVFIAAKLELTICLAYVLR
jgi:hypothetical protein